MRVLLFLEQLTSGGVEHYFLRKARELQALGHEVFLASAGGPLERDVADAGLPHLALPAMAQHRPQVSHAEALREARLLDRHLAAQRIEVVDTVAVRPFQLVYPLAAARGIPVFLECLSPVHFVPPAQANWVREVAEKGRLVGIVGHDLLLACERLGLDPGLGRVIPNPVDVARFTPGQSPLRAGIGAAPEDFVVLTVCRLDPDKATYVGWLIDDVAALAADPEGEAWLAIAGDGPERPALEARARARGLSRVRFLGHSPEPERLYPGADAFCGMGTTVLEAAACGTAVVLANAMSLRPGGASPEEAAVGLFAEGGLDSVGYEQPGAPASRFSVPLRRLRRDAELRSRLSTAGMELVRKHHALTDVVRWWEAALAGAVAASTRPDPEPERPLRVLLVTRPDGLERPGGDTTQALETRAALARSGVHADLSFSSSPDASGYDLVHVFNLQLPELAAEQVGAAAAAGVGTVLSPIFWDHSELEAVAPVLRGEAGDPVTGPGAELRRRARMARQRQAASLADLLLPNSRAEADTLRRVLGADLPPCRVVPNGADPARLPAGDAARFERRHGLTGFVLCAARWDDRKNLLQLCEALRETGLRLVLAGAQPDATYARLVGERLPPGALVLGQLEPADLADAYAAARVHALPSWFETPGLSSLEAAVAGCAIVVGNRAAEREYFGDAAYYCDPGDVGTIRAAILAAVSGHEADRPKRDALRERILAEFTWDAAARVTLEAYREVLGDLRSPLMARRERVEATDAAPDSVEAVVHLAPGVVLPPADRERLERHLALNPEAGAVGPLVRGDPGFQRPELHAAGSGALRADRLNGGCLVLRRSALAAIGGWDEGLAPEHAELDLAWRLRSAGFTLLVATDVVASVPASPPRPARELADGADRLAAKLETYYGRGRVPAAEALWGVSTFRPRLDLWGPIPTAFRSAPGCREDAQAAFRAAFGPEDPVTLDEHPEPAPPEPAVSGGSAGRPESPDSIAPRAGEGPVAIAARAVAGPPGTDHRVVELSAGVPATPELLRQLAGYRPRPEGRDLVSVIFRAVDSPDCTRLCLEALGGATAEPFELIVVDRGVGEATASEIARVVRDRPEALWLRPDGGGAGHLWNVGLAAAVGPFVALLDGDVLVEAGWLTYLLRHLLEAPETVAAGPRANAGPGMQALPGIDYAGERGFSAAARRRARDFAARGGPADSLGDFALLLRREVIERAGGFDPAGDPIGFSARVSRYGRLVLAEDVYVHRFGLGPGRGASPGRELEPGGDFWSLPDLAGTQVLGEPLSLEGMKAHNLLLSADWDGGPEPWLAAVTRFAERFTAEDPVTLIALDPPGAAREAIASVLEAARPAGDAPDVLVVEAARNLAEAVAGCQGVLLSGCPADAPLRRTARILGVPAIEELHDRFM